jgi:hypothetical protein
MSWKNSLPALAEVLKKAEMHDQLVILEYCPPSRDETPSRIDAVICGVDTNNKIHAVLIELKQWSHGIREGHGNFLQVHIAGDWRLKPHPRKQIEDYRTQLQMILTICNEKPDFIIFSAYAYLHNASHISPELKYLLFGKGEFDPDSRLYTKDFDFALANRLRELVGGGKGTIAFLAFKKLQDRAYHNAKFLPKRSNYRDLKIEKKSFSSLRRSFKKIATAIIFVTIPIIIIGGLLWIAFSV